MTSVSTILGIVLLSFIVSACSNAPDRGPAHELTGTAMGTSFSVTLLDPRNEFVGAELQKDIETLLADLNGSLSTYRSDSEISRFNSSQSTEWIEVSQRFCEVVAAALAVSHQTDGAFDITVGPLVNLWGFGAQGSIGTPPGAEEVRAAAEAVGFRHLHADCSIPAIRKAVASLYVDLSAYAKGFAVDRVADLLDARGVQDYLVEIGGELRLRGSNARGDGWAIGIESPTLTRRTVGKVVDLTDVAIATSGDYRNYFESGGEVYSHTIDPRTGYPITHDGASVTVAAQTAAEADAFATALLVMGPTEGLEWAQQEGLAALFQVRVDDAVEERASDTFIAMLAGSRE